MSYISDLDKYFKEREKSSTTSPKKVDVEGIKLKDSKSTTIETSKGTVKLKSAFKKIMYGAAVAGTVLGLAATGFGAANVLAIAVLPQFSIISFDTLTFGLLTGAGYKLTKKTLGTTMKNTPALKPMYDTYQEVKAELTASKSSKK